MGGRDGPRAGTAAQGLAWADAARGAVAAMLAWATALAIGPDVASYLYKLVPPSNFVEFKGR